MWGNFGVLNAQRWWRSRRALGFQPLDIELTADLTVTPLPASPSSAHYTYLRTVNDFTSSALELLPA
jgi:hypothetical protein